MNWGGVSFDHTFPVDQSLVLLTESFISSVQFLVELSICNTAIYSELKVPQFSEIPLDAQHHPLSWDTLDHLELTLLSCLVWQNGLFITVGYSLAPVVVVCGIGSNVFIRAFMGEPKFKQVPVNVAHQNNLVQKWKNNLMSAIQLYIKVTQHFNNAPHSCHQNNLYLNNYLRNNQLPTFFC